MVGMGFNGEIISGISLTLFGILLIIFGTVNHVASILIPADIMIICIGISVMGVGVWTSKKNALVHT